MKKIHDRKRKPLQLTLVEEIEVAAFVMLRIQ